MSSRVVKTMEATFNPIAHCLHEPEDLSDDECGWQSTQWQNQTKGAREAAKHHVRTTGHPVAVEVIRRAIWKRED